MVCRILKLAELEFTCKIFETQKLVLLPNFNEFLTCRITNLSLSKDFKPLYQFLLFFPVEKNVSKSKLRMLNRSM